jgi:energy-coupling factor transporter ATP-binding protein EcfA2
MSDPAHSRAHWLKAFALPATALGFPVLAVAALVGEVISSFWVAVAFVGMGELLLLLAVGMLRAWSTGQTVRRRSDRSRVGLMRDTLRFFGFRLRYQRRYLRALRARLCCIDVYEPPYRLHLDQVFISPALLLRPAHQVLPGVARTLPAHWRGGSHSIWHYLADPQAQHYNLVVLGAAGSGKTTLLKHLALALAGGHPRPPAAAQPDAVLLPIFLCLRDLAATIHKAPGLSLAEVASRSLGPADPTISPRAFEWLLHSGHALVVCDSLDELPDAPARRSVVGWLRRCMMTHPDTRFVLALDSVEAYALPPADTLVLDMVAPRQEQARDFVQRWYLAAEVAHAGEDTPDIRLLARQGADDVWNRLRAAPALATAARNPLLLTLITNLHYYGIPLPEHYANLYTTMGDLLLGQRQPARSPESQEIATRQQGVLRALAYEMMCRRQCEMTLSEALPVMCEAVSPIRTMLDSMACVRLLEDENGLLVRGSSDTLRFAHAAFQAALAAAHIQSQPPGPTWAEQVQDPWWHPVLRLYASQNDATPIVEACLADDTPSLPVLMLAVACVESASQLQPAMRARLEAVLAASLEDADPQRRAVVAEALLAERLRHMVLIGKDVYADMSLVSCAEYQLFLDEQHDQAHWPDHWPGAHFPAGQGRTPVLGVRASDALAFCEWLTRRDSGEWRYRLPWLGRHSHEAASGTYLARGARGSGYWGLTEAGTACMRAGDARPLVSLSLLTQRYVADLNPIAGRLHTMCEMLKDACEHARELEYATVSFSRTVELVEVLAQVSTSGERCVWLSHLQSALPSRHHGGQEQALDFDMLRFQNIDALPVALLDTARTRALAVIHAPAIIQARGLAVDLARMLSPGLPRLAPTAAAVAQSLDTACAQLGDLTGDLAHDVAALLDRSARPDAPDLWRDELARVRAVLPGWAALLACEEAAPPAGEPDACVLIDACMEVYSALVVLEERAVGTAPPLEGICIVRERAEPPAG